MSTRGADKATSITTALCWFGLGVLSFYTVWQLPKEMLPWYAKIAGGLAGGLAFIGYGLEALNQELTIPRWAISQLVFTTVGVVFVIAGIFNSNVLDLGRVVMFIVAAFYLLGALFSAAAAKDLF